MKLKQAEKLKSCKMKEGWMKSDEEWWKMMKDKWRMMKDEGWGFQAVEGFWLWIDRQTNRQTLVNVELFSQLKSFTSLWWPCNNENGQKCGDACTLQTI